jgi:hypothetical protein
MDAIWLDQARRSSTLDLLQVSFPAWDGDYCHCLSPCIV